MAGAAPRWLWALKDTPALTSGTSICRDYGRRLRIAAGLLAVRTLCRWADPCGSRRDSNSSRRPSICEYAGVLTFSQDVARPSVRYVP
jgi:hypothetical protein